MSQPTLRDRRYLRFLLTREEFDIWHAMRGTTGLFKALPWLPEDAVPMGDSPDHARYCWDVVIWSASFEEVPLGKEIPLIARLGAGLEPAWPKVDEEAWNIEKSPAARLVFDSSADIDGY